MVSDSFSDFPHNTGEHEEGRGNTLTNWERGEQPAAGSKGRARDKGAGGVMREGCPQRPKVKGRSECDGQGTGPGQACDRL